MAKITSAYIGALSASVRTEFNKFLTIATVDWQRFAMTIPSTTAMNVYAALDELPGLREWLGDRVVHDLTGGTYSIENRTFEGTVGLKREAMEDDQYGLFIPGVQQLGQNAGTMPMELVFDALEAGNASKCFDGQYFFDSDHVTHDRDGEEVSYANTLLKSNLVSDGTTTVNNVWIGTADLMVADILSQKAS